MKILLLTHFFGKGGSSSLALQIQNQIQRAGYFAPIIATTRSPDAISADVDYLFETPCPTKSKVIQAILNGIERHAPEVVYSISGTLEMDALRFVNIPRARHFSSLECHEHVDIKRLFLQAAPYFDAVTANTPDVLDVLKSLAPQARFATATFPYAFPADSLRHFNREKPAVPSRSPLQICYVGRFDTFQKRTQWLPEIMKKLASGPVPVEWHFYGDGPSRAPIEHEVGEIFPRVTARFHGWVSQSDLTRLLAQHDLFFLCSRWEGLPIAMVEAMLSGVACLVPDTCAGAGYALDSGGGWLYTATSAQSCVEKLQTILSNRVGLSRAGLAAQAAASHKFVGEVPAKQTAECIDMITSLPFNGLFDSMSNYRPLSSVSPMKKIVSRVLHHFSKSRSV